MRCNWSNRFMKVILLGLSLVSTSLQVLQYRCTVTVLQYKRTAVQLNPGIVCATQVCVGSVKLYGCTAVYKLCIVVQYICT